MPPLAKKAFSQSFYKPAARIRDEQHYKLKCLLLQCIYKILTVVSCHLLPTPTAVSTQSKRANWCNSHFIHCTKIEVGDGVWGCTRARHWASGVRGGSPSPVLHRVTSDHLTRSQCWSAPSDSDLASFIQCHHWHATISGSRYICWGAEWHGDIHYMMNIGIRGQRVHCQLVVYIEWNFDSSVFPWLCT